MSKRGLNFADLAAVRTWVDDLADRVDDLASTAEDQIGPPEERKLGPVLAREEIENNRKSVADLIAYARAGLPAPAPPEGP
jgi:hypothetical protein